MHLTTKRGGEAEMITGTITMQGGGLSRDEIRVVFSTAGVG